MSHACPQCGGTISSPVALCLECLKRVALRESAEFDETEAPGLNDLLPESAQRAAVSTANPSALNEGSPGERWGDYELLEPIGRGAMGTVFRARHTRLNRVVALKLISRGHGATEHERQRFLREAKAVARLHHPHIVTLYEAGEAGGQPYLAMEYVPGKTLAETVDEKPLPPQQAAECVKKIAEAIHYAHEQGVLHRDLKPSNVALDLNREPRVMDFGLARLVGQDSEMTLTGMALGSPSYMAPEQAAGKTHAVKAASDIYSLGAILYETLTARPPFQAESSVETMRQVVEKEPVSPRLLNASVPRDLETICLKCLEKEAPRRYRTAQELAEDLSRFLGNEPIHARAISAPAKLARWIRRKPALSFAIGAVALLLLVVAIGSPIAAFRINRERNLAEAAHKQEVALRVRAESAERQTEEQLYQALLEQARATVRSGELGQRVKALDAIRRAAAISNSAALRGVALVAHMLPDLQFERELPFNHEFTLRLMDPTFERIAVCRGRGPVEIRSTSDFRLLATLPASTNLPAYNAEWSADGRFLAVKRDHDAQGTLSDKEVWSVADAQRLLLLRDTYHTSMSFHPRLPRLLIARTNGASIWDVDQGADVRQIPLEGTPQWLRFAPDGERFAASFPAKNASMLSVYRVTGELLASNVLDQTVASFNWHPSGRWLAVADYGGGVRWVDARSGENGLLGRHKAEATRMDFSPDGAYLMSGGWDRELICWDTRTLQPAFTIWLNGYVGRFRSDGRAYSLETEAGLQWHTFEPGGGLRKFAEDLGPLLRYAAFSPDGQWLAAAAAERLGVWDLRTRGPGALTTNAQATRVAFAHNGELFASRIGAAFRWHVSPGTNADSPPELLPLQLAVTHRFTSLSVVSNGIAMSGTSGSAVIGAEELGAGPREWKRTVAGINGVSPDGQWLALFPSFTPYLYVHRRPDLTRVAILTNASNVRAFEFSPAGDELAVSCRSGVEFWSTTTWQRTRAITNLNNQLYSADGRTMWLTQEYRSGGLYDARTLELLLPLPAGTFPLAVSPDGCQLAVSVDLRRLQVWNLAEVREQLRQLGLDWQGETSR